MAASSNEKLLAALSMFKCIKDNDIEDFLHNKAINFENRGWCRVYLIVDEQELINNNIKIEGYFTLSNKSLTYKALDRISKTQKKKLTLGSSNTENIPFVLIGHLGKFISEEEGKLIKSELTIEDILSDVCDVIYQANELIPYKSMLIECKDDEKLLSMYQNVAKFTYLQKDGELHQLYKII